MLISKYFELIRRKLLIVCSVIVFICFYPTLNTLLASLFLDGENRHFLAQMYYIFKKRSALPILFRYYRGIRKTNLRFENPYDMGGKPLSMSKISFDRELA